MAIRAAVSKTTPSVVVSSCSRALRNQITHRAEPSAPRTDAARARAAAGVVPTPETLLGRLRATDQLKCPVLARSHVAAARRDNADRRDEQGINLELEVVHSTLLSGRFDQVW